MFSVASNDVSGTANNSTLYYLVVIGISSDTPELVSNLNYTEKTEEIRNYEICDGGIFNLVVSFSSNSSSISGQVIPIILSFFASSMQSRGTPPQTIPDIKTFVS